MIDENVDSDGRQSLASLKEGEPVPLEDQSSTWRNHEDFFVSPHPAYAQALRCS